MAATRNLTVQPPLGGVHKARGFQSQPPFTMVDSSDVWGVDAATGRARLAVRPAFASYGSQTNCKMIHVLDVAADQSSDRVLMTADTATVYYWTAGVKTAATMTASIQSTSRNFQAASYLSKLFIADDSVLLQYDHSTNAVTNAAATGGSKPTNCRLVCTWGARLVVAGDTSNPHMVYFSRVDDPLDYNYAADADDTGRAIQVAAIMQPVTAIIPYTRECLVACTWNSCWVFSGNPTGGGQLYKLSETVGAINGTAWCFDEHGRLWMLTRNGLYRMDGQCGSNPISVSREKIPESLLGLDGIADKAYLGYDTRFRCIHIYITSTGSNAQYFHYFPETESFWPVTAPGSGILSIGRYEGIETSDVSGLLIGTAGGLKRLDRTSVGGSAVATATIGPIRISPSPAVKGKIREAVVTLGELTSDTTGTLDFYTAESMELVCSLPVGRKVSVTVDNILDSRRTTINLSGHALIIKYTQGATTDDFALEQIDLTLASFAKELVA